MKFSHVRKDAAIQRKFVPNTESIVDSSSQSATLQRHASLVDGVAQRAHKKIHEKENLKEMIKCLLHE